MKRMRCQLSICWFHLLWTQMNPVWDKYCYAIYACLFHGRYTIIILEKTISALTGEKIRLKK